MHEEFYRKIIINWFNSKCAKGKCIKCVRVCVCELVFLDREKLRLNLICVQKEVSRIRKLLLFIIVAKHFASVAHKHIRLKPLAIFWNFAIQTLNAKLWQRVYTFAQTLVCNTLCICGANLFSTAAYAYPIYSSCPLKFQADLFRNLPDMLYNMALKPAIFSISAILHMLH